MAGTDRATALGNLRIAVMAFGRQLEEAEQLPSDGLEELKGAVDDVRLRIWGVLMAANSENYRGFRDRYRLRRAAEILRGLVEDVDSGALELGHREATDLTTAMRDLAQRLKRIPKVI